MIYATWNMRNDAREIQTKAKGDTTNKLQLKTMTSVVINSELHHKPTTVIQS